MGKTVKQFRLSFSSFLALTKIKEDIPLTPRFQKRLGNSKHFLKLHAPS